MPGIGGKKKETQMHVYGEIPGAIAAGGDLLQNLLGYLKSYQTGGGGQTFPGLREAQALMQSYLPQSWAAGQRAGQILSPEFLTQRPAGLQQLFDVWGQQAQRTEKDVERDLLMRFGKAGQVWSSPMVRALGEAKTQVREGLAERTGQAEMQNYQQRMLMQAQLIAQMTGLPLQAASLIASTGGQGLENLIRLILGGKGQPVVTQSESDGGWLGDVLGTVAGAYLKQQMGLA